jgi:hypothetical protein
MLHVLVLVGEGSHYLSKDSVSYTFIFVFSQCHTIVMFVIVDSKQCSYKICSHVCDLSL